MTPNTVKPDISLAQEKHRYCGLLIIIVIERKVVILLAGLTPAHLGACLCFFYMRILITPLNSSQASIWISNVIYRGFLYLTSYVDS